MKEKTYITVLVVGSIVLSISIWIVLSYFEAKTFTKLTGREVSLIDAMFVELRVIEPIK